MAVEVEVIQEVTPAVMEIVVEDEAEAVITRKTNSRQNLPRVQLTLTQLKVQQDHQRQQQVPMTPIPLHLRQSM